MALDMAHTRNLFLRCMCFVFLMAFISIYLQIRGLYGSNGVLPAYQFLRGYSSQSECLSQQLTLVCLAPTLGVSTVHAIEVVALLGIMFSAAGLVFMTLCRSLLFLLLVCCYGSLYNIDRTFLYFQWDSLLLETGWLCVVAAPMFNSPSAPRAPHSLVTFWLLRWLLFRFMFASGVVKLQSHCPTWWGLTALTIHYESQCIPTPLAWAAHQLPVWFHKLCVVVTFVVEIPVPFLFFSPLRSHRLLAFYGQVLLQVAIILTGNYNFFNLLTLTLCLTLLDDKHLGYRRVRDMSLGFLSLLKSLLSRLGYWVVTAALAYYTVLYFSLRLDTRNLTLESKTGFSKLEFSSWMRSAVPATICMGVFSLTITAAEALSAAIFESRGFFRKIKNVLSTLCYCVVVAALFAISLVPYTTLDSDTSSQLSPQLKAVYKQSQQCHLTGSYGLFRRMTGVGGRPEVQLEGSDNIAGPWLEYHFPYKPGALDRPLPVVAPYQPRLDWQMWFAALGSYNDNPWLLSLVYRLLQGTPEVVRLLDRESPWRSKPPKYIRAVKYLYFYTNFDQSSADWWKRQDAEEYLPVFSVDHSPLVQYLNKIQVLGGSDPHRCSNVRLCHALDALYNAHADVDPVLITYTVMLSLILVVWTSSNFARDRMREHH
uniref:Lipase maturation factor n=1 Tax=Hirondellea gigas TaxID=1518452 RepID=A0A2P2I687_9CRUS